MVNRDDAGAHSVRGMRQAPGELYELAIPPPEPGLSNADLAPTRVAERTWTTYNMASLWVSLSVCIPTYMLASGLVGGGMNWWQAILTIMLGNLIVCVPMVLIAHAGTRFGIPFPVLARASFGIRGSNVPAILRGPGGLRLVRHPDLDRRPGDLHHAQGGDPRLGAAVRPADQLHGVSGWPTCTSSCGAATPSSGSRPERRRS